MPREDRKANANTQSERFIRTARELGCDEDPEAFERAVRKVAQPQRRESGSANERKQRKPTP